MELVAYLIGSGFPINGRNEVIYKGLYEIKNNRVTKFHECIDADTVIEVPLKKMSVRKLVKDYERRGQVFLRFEEVESIDIALSKLGTVKPVDFVIDPIARTIYYPTSGKKRTF